MSILNKFVKATRMLSWKRFLAVIFLMALIIVFIIREKGIFYSENDIMSFLEAYPVLAPLAFILIYVLMIIFLAPTLPMNLGAGFLWGGFWGGIITLIASPLGAIMAFIIARYFVHDYFNNRFNNSIWNWLRERVQKNDWKIIAFTRLNPVFPFGLTSYFFGLTPASFSKFIASTILPIIPGVFLFAFLGHSINGIILGKEENQILQKVFIFSASLTFVIVFYFAVKKYFSIKKYNNRT